MNIKFTKLHGAGNDFIFPDYKSCTDYIKPDIIKRMCSRNRGAGADGLIHIIEPPEKEQYDIQMLYYNSDGSRAEMCGNGLRCAAYYGYKHLKLTRKLRIKTDAGILETENLDNNMVKIQIPVIKDFSPVKIDNIEAYFGNTGVPHLVIFVENIHDIDINRLGKYYRNHTEFMPEGTNVNFVTQENKTANIFNIRTYERGVEAETSACGTGISAAALCLNKFKNIAPPVKLLTVEEDILKVDIPAGKHDELCLIGPVEEVYNGEYIIPEMRKIASS